MISNLPTLDLHGEYRESAIILTDEFLNDNITLKNEYVCIVHGISGDVIRATIHEYLRKDKRVASFKRDFFNPGATIVKLKLGG